MRTAPAAAARSVGSAAGEIWERKQALRKQVRAVTRGMAEGTLAAASAAACHRLLALECVQAARSVTAYLEMPRGECGTGVLLEGLFRAGKAVYVPRVTGSGRADMQMLRVESMAQLDAFPRNRWGIPEPTDAQAGAMADALDDGQQIDLVVLPGVAFDRQCRRLGQGRGYYDTFLERLGQVAQRPVTIALGLQEL